MTKTLQEIATALQATLLGDGDVVIMGLAEPSAAGPDDLALAMSPRYTEALETSQARAAVVWDGADWQAFGLKAAIVVGRPRLAMAQLTQLMDDARIAVVIHPTAVIDPTANLGRDVSIGPFCVIGAGATLDAGAVLADHVTVAAGSHIGAASVVMSGVRIAKNVTIGKRCIMQPNVVIGGDGFSFVTATPSIAETARRSLGKTPFAPIDDATQHRIHSLGGVEIGDDVEVGANSTIDAGTIRATRVGSGTKIDNLVQVGHNVVIGRDCLLCAQTAVAGSAVIGDRTVLGGKSGVADNITIGSDCLFGGAAIALGDVADGSFVMGYPAKPMLSFRAEQRALRDGVARRKTD